jgi:translocation and assembly module TamA
VAPFRFVIAASGAAACLAGLASPALADVPKAAIRGEMPGELRTAIERAVGESKTAADSRLEARRRAREAAEDAIAVLRSEGYYAYEIFPDIGEGEKPEAFVTIEPGPRFHIANPRIDWVNAPPSPDVIQLGQKAMQLKEGDAGRAADVVAAEGRIVAALEKQGYADAVAEPRQVIVDHADDTVQPDFRVSAGDLVHLDGIDLRTTGRTNPQWVEALAPWKRGQPYDPDDVAELEQRLLDAGVYDSVTVALAPKDQMVGGQRPVIVSLADRPRGTIELGAGYSTSEGAGLDARWLRYNRIGRADTTTITGRLAEIERKLDWQIAFPHWRKPKRTLTIGANVFADNTDAFDDEGVSARVDLTTRYGRNVYRTSYRTLGLSVDATRTDERTPILQQTDLVTLTVLGALSQDRSDDPLDPKRGWKAEVRVEPTASTGDKNILYLRALAQGSAYLPFGKAAKTVGALRLRLGTVTGAALADIPAARRLYAGGGGSVRGYSYQGVGPRAADGTPQGGLSLFEASIELRQSFTQKWGGALFYDVGSVGGQSTPSFSRISTAVGAGVRYDLGFAPIRADLAIPLNRRSGDPSYQIYVSIGQSF